MVDGVIIGCIYIFLQYCAFLVSYLRHVEIVPTSTITSYNVAYYFERFQLPGYILYNKSFTLPASIRFAS